MSDKSVDWKNLRCLYAEDLKNSRVPVVVGGIRETPKDARLFCHNTSTGAWDVAFATPDKEGRTPYIQIPVPNEFGKRTALLRQYVQAAGGDPDPSQVGTEITLYPVESKKSVTGQAIRIAIPEQLA